MANLEAILRIAGDQPRVVLAQQHLQIKVLALNLKKPEVTVYLNGFICPSTTPCPLLSLQLFPDWLPVSNHH